MSRGSGKCASMSATYTPHVQTNKMEVQSKGISKNKIPQMGKHGPACTTNVGGPNRSHVCHPHLHISPGWLVDIHQMYGEASIDG
jgi:hypothetical protein